ncbi:MAG: 9-O-acetyl-N-acetylneuraminate esterase [Ruminococcus sp.]|nr:9-O-acetyl-N-acetylneuraminate esterase [Ruminococcus sp.]
MPKVFNVTGNCNPKQHYMVDLTSRLEVIKGMIDAGQYITINRARQYGKTTTLMALEEFLADEYYVLNMDFQFEMSSSTFKDENSFACAFAKAFIFLLKNIPVTKEIKNALNELKSEISDSLGLVDLFRQLSEVCKAADKPIVLFIDEVDQASNNQVFLDFLAQLRGAYIRRDKFPTFQSVILAGVHDIRNLQLKIRPDSVHKHNSPWNIANALEIDMSFSPDDIAGMLSEYESDYHTGMDIKTMSELIYDNTSGYPVLVSMFGKILSEQLTKLSDFPSLTSSWTREGFLKAKKLMQEKRMPLFESLINKLETNDRLRNLIYRVLFNGERISFNIYDATINEAVMYGFLKNADGIVSVSNRIFQDTLYEWFLSQELC